MADGSPSEAAGRPLKSLEGLTIAQSIEAGETPDLDELRYVIDRAIPAAPRHMRNYAKNAYGRLLTWDSVKRVVDAPFPEWLCHFRRTCRHPPCSQDERLGYRVASEARPDP